MQKDFGCAINGAAEADDDLFLSTLLAVKLFIVVSFSVSELSLNVWQLWNKFRFCLVSYLLLLLVCTGWAVVVVVFVVRGELLLQLELRSSSS